MSPNKTILNYHLQNLNVEVPGSNQQLMPTCPGEIPTSVVAVVSAVIGKTTKYESLNQLL